MKILDVKDYNPISSPSFMFDDDIESQVKAILKNVIKYQDQACIEATLKYDHVKMNSFKMKPEVLKQRFDQADPSLIEALTLAKKKN